LISESKRIAAPILVNGNLANGTNGSVLVGDGESQSYSKRYLTPFGEFIPFQSLVSKITDKASKVVPYIAGTDPYLFRSNEVKFRTLICYELLSDKQARSEMSDTHFIVTQTNNATYFKTWQLDQELSLAQARSAETYRQTAYVSTTGGTSLINEKGRIVSELPQYENGALIGLVKTFSGSTPAVRYGSHLEIGLLLLWFALTIRAFQRRFKKA
jgi:apolipoprotein N-acyltransferase